MSVDGLPSRLRLTVIGPMNVVHTHRHTLSRSVSRCAQANLAHSLVTTNGLDTRSVIFSLFDHVHVRECEQDRHEHCSIISTMATVSNRLVNSVRSRIK
jgi:hypothetical protein